VDLAVAKLDANGNHLWSKIFGDTGTQYAWGMAVDAAGDVAVTGAYDGTIDFGGGPLASAGSSDIYLAKLDPSGKHVWSKRFGSSTGDEGGYSAAIDAAGAIAITGPIAAPTDFGGGALAAGAYVAKFDASGQHLWSKSYGDAGVHWGNVVRFDP